VESKDRLEYIDALRGIAILGVLIVHSSMVTQQTGAISTIAFTGQRGVQLFYMVSAFTLYRSLDSPRREHYPISNFFIRRFFRIAPAFYLAIFANILLYALKPNYSLLRGLGWFQITLGFLFLHGASPKAIDAVAIGGWSVAVETTFYLLLPLLHRYVRTIRSTLLLFVISAALFEPLSIWLAHRASNPFTKQYFAFLWFPVEFPVFVLGMLAYRIWKTCIPEVEKRPDLSLLLIFASGLIFWGCLPFTNEQLYPSSLLFLTFILALSIRPWSFFVNPLTRFLGKISYSLYLFHFFVLIGLGSLISNMEPAASRYILDRPIGMVLAFLVLFAASVPICVFTWKSIEEPGIRLGRRWISYREERASIARRLVPSVPELQSSGVTTDARS
jgi:peptidoglycan/LPS O-acetylase OafA/YrhL